MKSLKNLFVVLLCIGFLSIQNNVSAQAEKIPMEFNMGWDCFCVGEHLEGHFTSVLILNANGEHWKTTGWVEGFSFDTGEPTGNVYQVRNVENYAYKLRSNGAYNPDNGVYTMQIRLDGKLVSLTHRSYTINYDENGEFEEIVWGGFFCSPQ